MGIVVILEGEQGEEVEKIEDTKNILHRLLPSIDDPSYFCIRFIDWYGNTVYNGLQMEIFIEEWQRIEKLAKLDEEKEILSRIADLAVLCQTNVHHYLKFYGD